MNLFHGNTKGFTLLEIIIVITLITIILGFVVLGFRNYSSYQQYNQAVSDVEFNLNQAKLEARIAADDESHGIKFSGGDMILFKGDTYSAVDPENETVSYALVDVTVELNDGGDEIIFSKLSGIPSATGTVIVTGNFNVASTTFTVSDSGVIQ